LINAENATYTGEMGVLGFQMLGGPDAEVPIQTRAYTQSSGIHWSESNFPDELMSPVLGDGPNSLSVLSIKSLEDLGYEVDVSKAEAYPNWSKRRQGGGLGGEGSPANPDDTIGRRFDPNVDVRLALDRLLKHVL
jgi:hypothetical protein